MPIPPVFVPFLHDHKAQQEAAREAAGELWQEQYVVFSRPDGRPLDPRADHEEFKGSERPGSMTAACTTGAATPPARF